MKRFGVLLFLLALLSPNAASAQTCVANSAGGPLDEDAHVIYLYVEADIATEIANLSTTGADAGLTMGRVVAQVMSAAEIWNLQSRSVALVFAGATTANSRLAFCNANPTYRPAVYVHVDETDSGRGASYFAPGGSNSMPGSCDSDLGAVGLKGGGFSAATPLWPIGNNPGTGSNGAPTMAALVHEFGHVIGLGHTTGVNGSVMNTNASTTAENGTAHLLNWDKDCADSATINTAGRSVYYEWVGRTAAGTKSERDNLATLATARGGMGEYFVESYSGANYHAIYDDIYLLRSPINSDGYDSWGYVFDYETWLELAQPDVAPFVFRVHEMAASAEGLRYNVLREKYGSSVYNPPYAQFIATDAALAASAPTRQTYYRHGSFFDVGVRTHLPVVATWDPDAEVTVFAWVQTASSGGDGQGTIWLHPGLKNAHTFAAGNQLTSGELGLPASGTNWEWMGQTYFPPAIACSDDPAAWDDYNCILVWNDRGLAQSSGYNLLYTFFRVANSPTFPFTKSIEVSGTTHVLNYSYASGPPAAAYIDDEMWIAFKATQVLPRIRAYSLTDIDDTSWFLESYESAPRAVDPVSFLYADFGESLTIWTNSF